jgi:hypothetical protein
MVRISGTQKKLGVALSLVVAVLVIIGVVRFFPTASNQGYAPEQPIPFSHKLHAGQNKIACLYCHSGAEKSRHATIPSLNVCMNCHTVVKTESPYIQKIKEAYSKGKPIEWIRVHELPDYVYFSHKRHVAKGVACETCHGNVKEMDRVEQKGALTMGWCMECHRGQTTPREVLAKVYPGVKNPKGPVAPVQCTTCHY